MDKTEITDAQVLAELLPDERQAWLHGITREERIMVMRRLALSRIEAREAAARAEAAERTGDAIREQLFSEARRAERAERSANEAAAREREAILVLCRKATGYTTDQTVRTLIDLISARGGAA